VDGKIAIQRAKLSLESSSDSDSGSSSAAPFKTADAREVLEEARGENGITEDFPDESCASSLDKQQPPPLPQVAQEASSRNGAKTDLSLDTDGSEESSQAAGGQRASPDAACQAEGDVPMPASTTEERSAALVDKAACQADPSTEAAPAAPSGEQTSPGARARGAHGQGAGQARQDPAVVSTVSKESPGQPLPSPLDDVLSAERQAMLECTEQQQQQKGDSQPSQEQEPVSVTTVQAASSAFDFFARVRRPVLYSELQSELDQRLSSEWTGLSDEARKAYQECERFQAEQLMAMQLPHCPPEAK